MTTFGTLTNRVTDGAPGLPGVSYRSEAKTLINEVYQQTVLSIFTPRKSTTVAVPANDGSLSISGDLGIDDLDSIKDIIWIGNDGGGQPLTYVDPAEINNYEWASNSPGLLAYYTIEGYNTLRLWPVFANATTLRIDYVYRPLGMSADEDEPSFLPPQFHDVLVPGALSKAWRLRNPNTAAFYSDLYDKECLKLHRWKNKMGGGHRRVVKGRRGIHIGRERGRDYGD